jgi:hypothetical protein
MASLARFRLAPRALSRDADASVIVGVRAVGSMVGRMPSSAQRDLAAFWTEPSVRSWNRIARAVSASRHLDLWENARLFALVNLAIADGVITGFEGNDPEYPSRDAVPGAAAAAVLARYFDSDFISFSVGSGAPCVGPRRTLWSFSWAAQEQAASLVIAGTATPSEAKAGYELGETVGSWVFDHALRPADEATWSSSATR